MYTSLILANKISKATVAEEIQEFIQLSQNNNQKDRLLQEMVETL